jgi:hypothetical protein
MLRVVSKWFTSILFVAFAIGYSIMAIEMMKQIQTVKPTVYKMIIEASGSRNIASEVSSGK